MNSITIPLPAMENWRTTALGVLSSAGYAAMTYYQNGGLSWKDAAGCAVWAAFCFLVGDGKQVNAANEKINALDLIARAKRIEEALEDKAHEPAV